MSHPHLTLIGGPTVLIDYAGLRFITDPTFDAPGDYELPQVTLHKTHGPALDIAKVGEVDAVLLSHDQHSDNLDTSGRAFLGKAQRVLTTEIGAQRLGGNAQGLAPWTSSELNSPHGGRVRVTATPARHGPAGIEPFAGDVVGFVLEAHGAPTVYITGDTVWYDGVADVARRFKAGIVVLFAGSAQTRGPFNLTMNVNDAIETAHAFPQAAIVPVHCDSWAHFTQDRDDLVKSFKALGIDGRLRLLEPGVATAVAPMA
ncbi:MAG: MBL fold metallo-hydrolase [Proteobacteria bacterium]|nr:MBL fold metallo-hydrolase [Pseudomonadota bacterium]